MKKVELKLDNELVMIIKECLVERIILEKTLLSPDEKKYGICSKGSQRAKRIIKLIDFIHEVEDALK